MHGQLMLTLALALGSANHVEEAKEFVLSVEQFRDLDSEAQRAMVKSAIDYRLRRMKNMRVKGFQRTANHPYVDEKIEEAEIFSATRRFQFWQRGLSYRISFDFLDSAGVREYTGQSALAERTGVVRSTASGRASPKVTGRIDMAINPAVNNFWYYFWLNTKPADHPHSNHILLDIQAAADKYQFSFPEGTRLVRLTIPWIPLWAHTPALGTREVLLDPERGFAPVSGHAYLSRVLPGGRRSWRDEKFTVGDFLVDKGLYVPNKITHYVRGSTLSESPRKGVVTVVELEISDLAFDDVAEKDVELPFPEGARVIDAIRGVGYTVGRNGEEKDVRTLLGAKSAALLKQKGANVNDPPATNRSKVFLALNSAVVATLAVLVVRKRREAFRHS